MEVIGERSDVKEAHSRERRQVAAQRDAFFTSLAAFERHYLDSSLESIWWLPNSAFKPHTWLTKKRLVVQ